MMRLALALSALSGRERWLLALLVAVALPAAIWLALAEPLVKRRAEARTALAQAADTRAWLISQRAVLAALPPPPPPGPPPEGLGGLEARLATLNLPRGAGQLADAGDGAVTLRLTSVPFVDLMPWLEGVQAQAGYRLAAITLTTGPGPALVTADLRLEPAP
jgi:general secretion pathway protein M